jgi:hypothetical protein
MKSRNVFNFTSKNNCNWFIYKESSILRTTYLPHIKLIELKNVKIEFYLYEDRNEVEIEITNGQYVIKDKFELINKINKTNIVDFLIQNLY